MANNPIKASDLYQDDGAIEKAIEQLKALQGEYEKALKAIGKEAISLQVNLKKLNATQAGHRDEIKKTATATDRLQKEKEKYNALLDENNVKIAALKNAQRTLNQVHKLEAKLAASKAGSYNALSAQYSLNKIRLNQMSDAERNATKEGQKLEKQSKELYEEMKRLQEATGKHTLSVGDYGKALRDLPGPLSQAKDGLDNLGGAMKALIRNPFLGLIGLIAGALVGLFQAFKKSSKGAELLARIGGVLQGVFSVFIAIANDMAEVLVWAFENPREAVTQLWQTIKTQIVERMKGVIDLFGAVGRAIWNSITLQFGEVAKAVQDAGKAVDQVFGDVAEYVREVSKEVATAADAFADLAVRTREVARVNRQLAKSIEAITTEEQLLLSVADDITKSFQEREEAAEKARKATEERAKLEIQIARNRLSLINQEINLRKGQDIEGLLDDQLSAYQALAQAEREFTLAVRDNERTRAELKQDRLERDLDILIDGFDNQKSINERLIKDEERTLAERSRIFSDTVRLADDSFRKQIETIQQFTGVQVNANELIAESDAVVLNQKIRSLGLSEIIEGRLLEIVRDRKTAIQDLAEVEADLIRERQKMSAPLASIGSILDTRQMAAAVQDAEKFIQENQKRLNDRFSQPENLSIYDYLGLTVNDEQEKELDNAFKYAKDQLLSIFSLQKQLTDQRVQQAEKAVNAAQNELQTQIALAEAGYANRVELAQKELALAKDNQRKAQREQEKAAKAELAIQTIQQSVNLITAASKIFSTIPFPFSLGAVATMFGAFAAAKIKAFQLSKTEFAEGGLEFIGGGSHRSGQDTPLGFAVDGKPAYAERGESHMVLKPGPTKKYRSILPEIFQSLNTGTFEKVFGYQQAAAQAIPVTVQAAPVRMDRTETELARIRKQGATRTYTDGRGRVVEVRGNRKTIYVS